MSNEFLDYVEDILDAMDKAELLLENVNYTCLSPGLDLSFDGI
jgi:hypothetical protein